MLIMQRVIFVNIFLMRNRVGGGVAYIVAYIIEFKGEYIRNKLK